MHRNLARINEDADVSSVERDYERAILILRSGGVIALPTDTVYGLAASIEHPSAVERLFTIKGRAGTKAIPVLISDVAQLDRLSSHTSPAVERLARAYWPGALTIVVEASDVVPDAVLRGGTTVGVRMPDCGIALAVIEGAGGALAVTSANRSGEREARSAAEVRARLGARVDFVVDGGRTGGSSPSTVVDVSGSGVVVLRHGAVPESGIREVLSGGAAP